MFTLFTALTSMVVLAWLGGKFRDLSMRSKYERIVNEGVDDPTSPLQTVPSAESLPASIDRVEVRVVGFREAAGGKHIRVSRTVCVAFLRKDRVLIRPGMGSVLMRTAGVLEPVDCTALYLELMDQMQSDMEEDPIGFLDELVEKYPDGDYAAAVGAPFAVCYYCEAA